jgi:hypothetical protein
MTRGHSSAAVGYSERSIDGSPRVATATRIVLALAAGAASSAAAATATRVT